MKKMYTFLVIITLTLGLKAQVINANTNNVSTNKASTALLVLKEALFDFGKIQSGRPVTHEFEIVNAAADTLKLENVTASCGCTTPVWKKEPVTPGGSTTINVGYNALSEGPFEKQVTVYYNGGQTKSLTIKGNVKSLQGEAGIAPGKNI